jgi:DoxX-like protein
MHAVAHAATHTAPVPTMRRWAGRIVSAFAVLFLVFDGAIKALRLEPAVEATAQLGYPERLTAGIGLLELACLVVYVMPRTAPLGAILLTGYLGGAVATHARIGSPLLSVVFPIIIGGLLWGGLVLRDARLRALLTPPRP